MVLLFKVLLRRLKIEFLQLLLSASRPLFHLFILLVYGLFFQKRKEKNLLFYTLNGQLQTIDLGPLLPYHDLAHYLVETYFQFQKGFFGYLKAGKSMEELSTTTGISTLDKEIWLAEILTRNLQALHSGSLTPEQYIPLVTWELEQHPDLVCPAINLAQVQQLQQEYQALCRRWEALEEGETLVLEFL